MSMSAAEDVQRADPPENAAAVSGAVRDHLKTAIASMGNWVAAFPEAALSQLAQAETQREVGKLAFIDGYHRIRQTSPLILAAIQSLDRGRDHDNSRFWVHHLGEEYGHDAALRRDIVAMTGGEGEATRILDVTAITP